jgi:hypothetical protein
MRNLKGNSANGQFDSANGWKEAADFMPDFIIEKKYHLSYTLYK